MFWFVKWLARFLRANDEHQSSCSARSQLPEVNPMVFLRILCGFALALAAQVALAQPTAQGGTPRLDPATLTQQQIANVQVPEVLYGLAANYKASGDHERLLWSLQRLIVLQPNVGDLKLALATAYAVKGDRSKTYETLLKMQQQGYGYDLADNPNFEKVHGTEVWTFIVDTLKKALARTRTRVPVVAHPQAVVA